MEFALQSGQPLQFGGCKMPGSQVKKPRVITSAYTKLCKYGVDLKLVCMLSDTTAFTTTLNTIDKLSRLDPLDFSEQAFQLIHRLIDFASLQEERPSHPLDDLLQLTLLALMTTALPNYTNEERHYKLLANHSKRAILRYVATLKYDCELLLCAIFVGRLSVFHRDQDDWIVPVLLRVSRQAQIHEWPQVRQILGRYCFVHTLRDTAAMSIWEILKRERLNEEQLMRLPLRPETSVAV